MSSFQVACPVCGHENADEARNCARCGAVLPAAAGEGQANTLFGILSPLDEDGNIRADAAPPPPVARLAEPPEDDTAPPAGRPLRADRQADTILSIPAALGGGASVEGRETLADIRPPPPVPGPPSADSGHTNTLFGILSPFDDEPVLEPPPPRVAPPAADADDDRVTQARSRPFGRAATEVDRGGEIDTVDLPLEDDGPTRVGRTPSLGELDTMDAMPIPDDLPPPVASENMGSTMFGAPSPLGEPATTKRRDTSETAGTQPRSTLFGAPGLRTEPVGRSEQRTVADGELPDNAATRTHRIDDEDELPDSAMTVAERPTPGRGDALPEGERAAIAHAETESAVPAPRETTKSTLFGMPSPTQPVAGFETDGPATVRARVDAANRPTMEKRLATPLAPPFEVDDGPSPEASVELSSPVGHRSRYPDEPRPERPKRRPPPQQVPDTKPDFGGPKPAAGGPPPSPPPPPPPPSPDPGEADTLESQPTPLAEGDTGDEIEKAIAQVAEDRKASAAPRPPGGITPTQKHRALEAVAAARIAAAGHEAERTAAGRRLKWALLALVAVGIAAVVVALLLVSERRAFKAELAGDLTVTRAGDAFDVVVPIKVSAPGTVRHPGGASPIEGDGTLKFSVAADDLQVGDNDVEIEVEARPAEGESEDDAPAPVKLTLQVRVYYRFGSTHLRAPKAGVPVPLELLVMEGWTPKLDPAAGKVKPISGGRFELQIDPAPLLERLGEAEGGQGQLPLEFSLVGPAGETQSFTETLTLPLPRTQVQLSEPTHGWSRPTDSVRIAGRAPARTEITVGPAHTVADSEGRFGLQVALAGEGTHRLRLVARAPGRQPSEKIIHVERPSDDSAARSLEGLRRKARAYLSGAGRPPSYRAMLKEQDKLEGKRVRIEGEVIAARRSDDGEARNQVQLVTCSKSDGCPVWVEVDGPVPVDVGDRATVAGKLAGTQEYTSRGGEVLTVPRILGAYLLP